MIKIIGILEKSKNKMHDNIEKIIFCLIDSNR